MDLTGQTIDSKYEVVRPLGEGGMGAVYEAKHKGTGRLVAVKVIHGDLSQKNPQAVGRFHREAKAAGSIATQHIAQVLDFGTDPGTTMPYLVMELLKGEDLKHLLSRVGPLPPDVALRIAAQACVGLVKAHEARVIHRDIKPANLFLVETEEGEIIVKVLDFGIAKIKPEEGRDIETTGLTRSGGMIGSPLYMSPEQARGTKDIDYRTDLWSLGVVLYHALAGRAPHADVDGFGELIMALCSQEPGSVQSRAPWVTKEVAALVHRALRRDPSDRYPSAPVMLEALKERFSGGLSLKASELVGLTPEARAVAAPKFEFGITAPSSQPVTGQGRPKLPSSSDAATGKTGEDGAPSTEGQALPLGRRRWPMLLGGAVALGALALVLSRSIQLSAPQPSPSPTSAIRVDATSPPQERPTAEATVKVSVTADDPSTSKIEERRPPTAASSGPGRGGKTPPPPSKKPAPTAKPPSSSVLTPPGFE